MPVDVLSSLVHAMFFMFSSYFADFCVPLFVELFACAFQCMRDSGVLFGTLIYDSEPCRSA